MLVLQVIRGRAVGDDEGFDQYRKTSEGWSSTDVWFAVLHVLAVWAILRLMWMSGHRGWRMIRLLYTSYAAKKRMV